MNEGEIKIWEWRNELSVGVSVIDEDHKKLLGLLNELEYVNNADATSKKAAIESVISELMDYTDYHFKREEVLMQACGYPGLMSHKQTHEILQAQTKNHLENYKRDSLAFDSNVFCIFLRNWLLEHIAVMDKDYESWMRDKDDVIASTNASFENERQRNKPL